MSAEFWELADGAVSAGGKLTAQGIRIKDLIAAAAREQQPPGEAAAAGRSPRTARRGLPLKVLAELAAHPDGLISRQLAELHGQDTGQPVMSRYGAALRVLRDAGYAAAAGTAPSGPRNTPAVVHRITGAGRRHLAAAGAPRPEPPARQYPQYPWEADAERRYLAGEQPGALVRDYGVRYEAVRRVLERRGVQIRDPVPRPHRHPRPGWAAEAARRYRSGETRMSLCAAYKVSDSEMTRILQGEGVVLRTKGEARRLFVSARRQGGGAGQAARPCGLRPHGSRGRAYELILFPCGHAEYLCGMKKGRRGIQRACFQRIARQVKSDSGKSAKVVRSRFSRW